MKMKKCPYERCNELRWVGHECLCILHDPSPNKDAQLFTEVVEDKIRREEEDYSIETINLKSVVFPAEISWEGRFFEKSMSFERARFLKRTGFSNAQFKGLANFTRTQFGSEAHFSEAQFAQRTDFVDAEFNEAAIFRQAEFSRHALFLGARFAKVASFFEAKFSWDVCLAAHFGSEAQFGGATFLGRADFGPANFVGEASFANTLFRKEAVLTNAKFSTLANFFKTRFAGPAEFSYATFLGELRLWLATFPSEDGGRQILFDHVTFKLPQRVFFEHVDLSNVSFLHTDLSQVNLIDVAWPKRPEPLLGWLPHFKDKIVCTYDHIALPERLKTNSVGPTNKKAGDAEAGSAGRNENYYCLVENLYRQLKFNLESRKNFIEAGDFHIGEMEMRRLNPETPGHYRFFLEAYKFFAHYGESYFRPFFYWGAFGLLFAFLYLFSGFKVMEEPVQYEFGSFDLGAVPGFFWHFVQALAAALTVPPLTHPDFHLTSSWVAPFRSLNSLLIVILIALALIALRRRFKR